VTCPVCSISRCTSLDVRGREARKEAVVVLNPLAAKFRGVADSTARTTSRARDELIERELGEHADARSPSAESIRASAVWYGVAVDRP
jgi:hypothetical protein